MNYLDELNDAQRAAVENISGPMMVIAGAGSGKTRVLTYRVAHLINNGVDPFGILALTFTNKAAREMKSRIGTIVGDGEARNIWMGTFHSIFARILRIEADHLNYPRNFTIYDTQDSKSLIKDIVKEMGLDPKIYKPGVVFGRISSAKNNLISPEAYQQNVDIVSEDHQTGKPKMAEIYLQYALRCFKAGAMDFDDLLFKTNVLLRSFPDILYKYQHKFKYILVDEYQDTNFSQYLIVKQLAAAHQNLCVVGDDAQSIYAFRGANIQNILNFQSDYPDFKQFKLEQNYRSTQTIVNAANSIIAKNKDQIQKEVWTSNDAGAKINVHQSFTDNEEGKYVAGEIFELVHRESKKYSEFAILYRTNAQSRPFEESLRKNNLPYRIYGGLSFYQRKEIKDLLAYFRLAANHNDEEAFKRVVNYPARGIGKTTIEKLTIAARNAEVSLWDVLKNPHTYKSGIANATQGKLNDFATMIESYAAELNSIPAYDLGHLIATSSGILKELYDDKSPEGVARYENIQELLNGMKNFSDQEDNTNPGRVFTLSDFLIDVALLTDADNDDDDDNKVSLMTIHAAKGLEFPVVFVVGLEENLFPSQLSLHSRSELEEERRLFYVALTRAEQIATLSYATSRYRWGTLTHAEPSRFIDEIDEKYINIENATRPKTPSLDFSSERQRFQSNTAPLFAQKASVKPVAKSTAPIEASDQGDIEAGQEVMHERFGKGKVLSVEGDPANKKATVFFPKVGQKQLLLRFAKLQIL
ncbi:MAG: UvrD-helicase domain-containing protein [Flavobacteriales bacterium]|nr:UvrD-helicase domain-containing protein [Flavobacteriales bacterium]